MARRPGDVQVQIVMPPEMRTEIDEALLKLRDSVPTTKLMDRGTMLRFLVRWFLDLPRDMQLQAVLAGKEIAEEGVSQAAEELLDEVNPRTTKGARVVGVRDRSRSTPDSQPSDASPSNPPSRKVGGRQGRGRTMKLNLVDVRPKSEKNRK